jgi:uncharacterized protein (DUF305 family)
MTLMRTRIHNLGIRRNHHVHPGAVRPAARRRALRDGAVALALAAVLGVTLTACGSDSDSGSPSATQTASNGDVFNDADVSFATAMIQHHAQALAMVALADGRPLDPAVKKLTEQIRDAQAPEIETMTDWLSAWDQEVPATVNDHAHGGHDMGNTDGSDMDMGGDESSSSESSMGSDTGAGMPGMMTAEQMDQLKNASDVEFQDMWLQMMVEHHQGAIEMAQDEVDQGTFGDALTLAKHIETSQQAEIEKMEGILG